MPITKTNLEHIKDISQMSRSWINYEDDPRKAKNQDQEQIRRHAESHTSIPSESRPSTDSRTSTNTSTSVPSLDVSSSIGSARSSLGDVGLAPSSSVRPQNPAQTLEVLPEGRVFGFVIDEGADDEAVFWPVEMSRDEMRERQRRMEEEQK